METPEKPKQGAVDTTRVVDAILAQGVDFVITVAKKSILHRLKILPVRRKVVIYPIYIGTLLRISKVLSELDISQFADGEKEINLIEVGIDSIVKNADKMVKIIGYAIVNSNKEPSKRLLRFLKRNLSTKEMLRLMILVIRQMDVSDFLACTVSATGLNLMKVETGKK